MSIRKQVLILATIALLCLIAACGASQPSPTPEPEEIASPTQTIAAEPEETVSPTQTIAAEPQETVSLTQTGETEPQGPVSGSPPSKIFQIPWDDRSLFREGLVLEAQGVLDGMPTATVYHIDIEISDDLLSLEGQETVHYTNNEDTALEEIYFRLFPNATGGSSRLSEVRVDNDKVEVVLEFNDTAIRIPLKHALQPGESVDIHLNFALVLPQEMESNYGEFGSFDGTVVLAVFYPVIPVYDDEGWNVESPPPNADPSYFDTSFYLVRVTAPADLVIAASGVEFDRQGGRDKQTVSFAAGPARDFYLAADRDYVLISETAGETTINSYASPEWKAGAELTAEVTAAAFKSFGARFGTYPYTEYDIVSTPMLALGIEYPGITAILTDLYDLESERYGMPTRYTLEPTVAHEAGHQWFYNMVGNDQIDEPWLDEAITQYVTGLYYLDTYGESAAASYRDSWEFRWERVERAEIPIGLPADAYVDKQYGAIVYGRGPIFVSALAKEMGQESFDEYLRDYFQSHLWGIGTGDAFRQLAEKHCQCDLSALFEAWVY
jgi:hypothetical protein